MERDKIGIVGLGYVGLPLARLFATKYAVVGFDINPLRVEELKAGKDVTREVEEELLKSVLLSHNPVPGEKGLFCTTDKEDIKDCNYFIITVPTPVDKNKHPDLHPLYRASETVGSVLKKGDIVIYESTVYPGATEEECVPVLEKQSELSFNRDFYVGYSPERINPGDKEHTVERIKKITSGSTPEISEKVDQLYRSIIKAGTHLAPSIKVAEAAKVIENAQRDINIAFVNELSKIFGLMDIDTHEVLRAAGTKWNFLPFTPGLVGGHCIGVDPYYLAQKAQSLGYHPEIILAGRRINDGMGEYIANQVIKRMIKNEMPVKGANLLVLGFTFKENCPDIRNTRVVDVIRALKEYEINVDIHDPLAHEAETKREYNLEINKEIDYVKQYDVVILAVSHNEFREMDFSRLIKKNGFVYDIKSFLDKNEEKVVRL